MTYTFIFFGIIGSGKGTQIDLLKKYLKEKTGKEVVYAGTGEGFRKLIGEGNYTSSLIKSSLEKGELQPDFFATSIIVNKLSEELTEDKHLITDGYPRNLNQSKETETMMNYWKREKIDIIHIELDKEEAMKRNLKRGRADDNEDAINKRFDVYFNEVVPSMEYFKNKKDYRIHTINGKQSIEEVHRDIIKSLNL